MRITDIETIFVDRYLFVKVHTDAGITGLGESGAWGYLEASAAAVETFKRYLIGEDPLRIEHHWQYLYRWTHFRGAADHGRAQRHRHRALGHRRQALRRPRATSCMGGKTRDKARVYYHVFGDTKEKLIQGCIDAKEPGLHRRRPPHALPRRSPQRALLQDPRRQDAGRHRHGRRATATPSATRSISASRSIAASHPPRPSSSPAASSSTTPSSTKTPSCPTASTPWPWSPTTSTSPSPPESGSTPSTSSRPCSAAARSSTCAPTSASPAASRTARRSPPWPRRTTSASCRTTRSAPSARPPACSSPPASPTSPCRNTPPAKREPPKSEIVKTALKLEDGFLIIPDAPGIGIELAEDAAER